jgi:predicted site-specific integrase-resolvase
MKMKISEYAKLKGVTYRTVWNWVKRGYVIIEKSKSGLNYVILDDEDVKDLRGDVL